MSIQSFFSPQYYGNANYIPKNTTENTCILRKGDVVYRHVLRKPKAQTVNIVNLAITIITENRTNYNTTIRKGEECTQSMQS